MKEDVNNSALYAQIMVEAIEAIFNYLHNVSKEVFMTNPQLQDACLMRLIVIGEYAAKIPESLQKQHPEIEWRSMKLARNFYVHGYAQVEKDRVWETIHTHLKPLKQKLLVLAKED